ncbi:MAG: hypothetical protein IPI44_24760 [Sulfuritalea sp.]|nr:hypothetical protein [Sulfuritalea sp.]
MQRVACQPFNGVASNVELIFSPNSPTQDAESVLLITDAQLVEKDREKFVQGFSTWMRDAMAAGGQPYAGVALVEAEFAGRYFPVSGSPVTSSGTHNRPPAAFLVGEIGQTPCAHSGRGQQLCSSKPGKEQGCLHAAHTAGTVFGAGRISGQAGFQSAAFDAASEQTQI